MRLLLVFLVILGLSSPLPAAAAPLTIYAAASTVGVMRPIQDLWSRKTGDKPRIVFGSSGALARQISAGAPADVYVSANGKWVDYLVARKHAQPNSRKAILANRLVLIAPAGAERVNIVDLSADIPSLLANGGRLALGDPRHVPAGHYAREALTGLGIWTSVAARTARTRNVRLALALVQRGEAALGIVYRTDARNDPLVRILATLPDILHSPIEYEAIGIRAGHPDTGDFLTMLTSADAKTLYRDAGFSVPE